MSEWTSDYSLMPNDQLFSYFMVRKSYNFDDDDDDDDDARFVLDQHA